MTATATTSTWQSSHGQSHSRSSYSSTSPRGYSAMPNSQVLPPQLSPTPTRSPHTKSHKRSPSPSYFGFVVNDESVPPDSNPGHHTRQNWNYSASSRGSNNVSLPHQSNENNPAYEAFRKQSESYGLNLSKNFPAFSRQLSQETSNASQRQLDVPSQSSHSKTAKSPHKVSFQNQEQHGEGQSDSYFGIPRQESPMQMPPMYGSVADHKSARLSLPASDSRPNPESLKTKRSDTVPHAGATSGPVMMSPLEIVDVMREQPEKIILLDLRVFPQFASARIQGALNLCIPTTLLKRPSFTIQKLADTFTSSDDQAEFAKWEVCTHIIVYDASSLQSKEAVMPMNVLNKFTAAGWKGQGLVIKGGFHAFAKVCPSFVDRGPVGAAKEDATQSDTDLDPGQNTLAVAGGCSMPKTESAANPFFSNIRQNMDLIDGVGQMPIKKPMNMSAKDNQALPAWLREASNSNDEGKQVSDQFLKIEQSEQRRMQKALSAEVVYGAPSREESKHIQVAGIEKGSKNRYNNIFPYDHTRVKLQNVSREGCDYVNANFVKASYSNRKYIATQAPIPATFDDFWRVIWEQDVRVVVMLTAEAEGGQVKSHVYWNSGDYGPLKVKLLSERQSILNKSKSTGPRQRPLLGTRRSTQPHTADEKREAQETNAPLSTEQPQVTVRHFTVSHSSQPFQPMREITQIHYTQWPDFGAPTNPMAILGLVEQVNKYVRLSSGPDAPKPPYDVATEGQRPIIVHCSAGCGRTGTFCTVDSVIDMLKRQKIERVEHQGHRGLNEHEMDVDVPDEWVSRDDIDLIAKTVNDFRHQRLSMVQNLRQFVLCYESILQWVVTQEHVPDPAPRLEARGKSFHGSLG